MSTASQRCDDKCICMPCRDVWKVLHRVCMCVCVCVRLHGCKTSRERFKVSGWFIRYCGVIQCIFVCWLWGVLCVLRGGWKSVGERQRDWVEIIDTIILHVIDVWFVCICLCIYIWYMRYRFGYVNVYIWTLMMIWWRGIYRVLTWFWLGFDYRTIIRTFIYVWIRQYRCDM